MSQEDCTNLPSCCCPTGLDFETIYGQAPTGLKPDNIDTNANTNLWNEMFGPLDSHGKENWWQTTSSKWVNPFDTEQQNPRNCINFRNKCPRNNRISLALKGDCCGDICTDVLDGLRLRGGTWGSLQMPTVEHRTVTVMGPTSMCKGSTGPPITLEGIWSIDVALRDESLHPVAQDYILYQVSRNGHSWTTLPKRLADPANKPELFNTLFDLEHPDCVESCVCLNSESHVDGEFPEINAFWGQSATSGQVRTACPPKYCFFRILAIRPLCIESVTATYANGGGLCAELPTCPAALVYEDRVCRPLPKRAWPGMAPPMIEPWDTEPSTLLPGQPIYPSDLAAQVLRNRQLMSAAKQLKKQFPGGEAESLHVRKVRAVAAAPWNSRATSDTGSSSILLNPAGYACGKCNSTLQCVCGVGCAADGDTLPRSAGCGWPAACRRQAATKHQTDDCMLSDLVACAVAGCRLLRGNAPCSIATRA